jgi:two-component system chemotaxis response regulator CheY
MGRLILRSFLRSLGYKLVVEAEDELHAIEVLDACAERNEPIELVFLDMNTPRRDGMALLRSLRAHPKYANLPVIMAASESEERHPTLEAGADGFLAKPIRIENLQETLERVAHN